MDFKRFIFKISLFIFLFIQHISFSQERMITQYHVVKRGESLASIAKAYNVPVNTLKLQNKLGRRTSYLRPGKKLIIRKVSVAKAKVIAKAKGVYMVQAGDTPQIIARKYGVTVEQLKRWNHHLKNKEIKQGNFIYIQNPPSGNTSAENIEFEIEEPSENPSKTQDISISENPPLENNSPTESILKPEESVADIAVNIPTTNLVNKDAIAVIIGNQEYSGKDVPDVDFALNDAATMKQYLVKSLGYQEGNIIYVENADQATFNAIFGIKGNHKGKLYNYIKPGQSDVFIYYSGHGGPDPETKTAFFIPVNCDPNQVAFNGYATNTFYENLSQLEYKSLTVIIDACFSGASEGGALLQNVSPVFIKAETRVLNDEKAAVFTSAGPEQVSSWYPEKSHSLFSYYFMKGLQGDADLNEDKKVTVGEMETYLEENVTYWARRLHSRDQNPEIYGEEDRILIAY
ncbi:LysM peptidoglycan-binding domain-containing protein [Flexithrix dorotheae]|uniref:LysM peptidoglycan-binding domain-containing protein n=1 Tax=Flexithrix dorotheae TaxID=70993 RepID=UPI000368A9DB|nr:LysM peptidoglycan-binding domain-containing protein [Flexithrix dorotheae]